MTIIKRHLALLGVSLITLVLLSSSCNCLIDDKYTDCGLTFEFKPYHRTPCMDAREYPADVKDMLVVVTDESGRIVVHKTFQDVVLSPDTAYSLHLPKGKYGFLRGTVWANAIPSDYYTQPGMENGQDFARYSIEVITNPLGVLMAKKLPVLYHGDIEMGNMETSVASSDGPFYGTYEPNLVRYTNDFNIKIKGLQNDTQYYFDIKDKNKTYQLNGQLIPQDVIYRKEIHQPAEGVFEMSTMQLDITTTQPMLSLKSIIDGVERDIIPEEGQNLKELLLKVPNKRFDCDFIHEVEITVHHLAITIAIDGWKVYSHDIVV